MPQYLTDLTRQQKHLAQLKEVFLLYFTFFQNTCSASNDSAVPVTDAFLPPDTHKKASYKIPVSKCTALSKGSLLLQSAHWQSGKYKKENTNC